jgi:hypothetical protein
MLFPTLRQASNALTNLTASVQRTLSSAPALLKITLSSSSITAEMPAAENGTVELDNSGAGPLKVPGFNGIPIDYIPKGDDGPTWSREDNTAEDWPLFQHGANSWHGQRLTVREIACEFTSEVSNEKVGWSWS